MIQSQNELKDGNWSFWKASQKYNKSVHTVYYIHESNVSYLWRKLTKLFTENIQKKEFLKESDLFDESGLNDSFTKGTDSSF